LYFLQQPLDTFGLYTHYPNLYKPHQADSQRATKEARIGDWKAVEVEKASIRSLFLKEALDVAERTRV